MKVTKAVITAAAPEQHSLPLQRLIDRNGTPQTVLQLIISEVVGAGIEEIGVVIQPHDEDPYRLAAGGEADRLVFIRQSAPRGYGHALFQAQAFADGQPVLHLVGDHLYLSASERNCAKQLVDMAALQACAVSGVQATRENRLSFFGAVGGQRVPNHAHLYDITAVLEKPTPTQAEQSLIVAGLRAGYYLCFFGMHVLTPTVFEVLGRLLADSKSTSSISLSAALARLAERERYLALEVEGSRYNIGIKYGLLFAQLALSLSGRDRDQVLSELIELLAIGPSASYH